MTDTIKSLIHQEALERYQPMPHESKTGMGAQRLGRRRKDFEDGAEWAVTELLLKIAGDAFEAGEEYGYDVKSSMDWGDDPTKPDKEQYINSLLQSLNNQIKTKNMTLTEKKELPLCKGDDVFCHDDGADGRPSKVANGTVIEVGDESIVVQWEDLEDPTEYEWQNVEIVGQQIIDLPTVEKIMLAKSIKALELLGYNTWEKINDLLTTESLKQ